MAEFLKGDGLNHSINDLFNEARHQLIIISPYIKVHSRLKDELKAKKEKHNLSIIIVFGKNEDQLANSFSKEEFDFFKDFPNIKIYYKSNLHAKYYANDDQAILSSMNLYDYSQNNNIEFGVLTKITMISEITGSITGNYLDKEALAYFKSVIKSSDLLFENVPQYESRVMGVSKRYTHSETTIDELSGKIEIKTSKKNMVPNRNQKKDFEPGYCIRTGVKIPFDPQRPLSDEAYKSWAKYKEEGYPEKYCHFSGEASKGDNSFKKPIISKNWKRAQKFLKEKLDNAFEEDDLPFD